MLYVAIFIISLLTGGEGNAASENPSQSIDARAPAKQSLPRVGINSSSSQLLSKYPGGSYALLIGVSKYETGPYRTPWDDLPGVSRDINRLKTVLEDRHSFEIIPTNIGMTFKEAKREIEQLLWKKYEGNARVFIFLSGHGYVDRHRQRNTPRTFFILADTPSPGNATTGAKGANFLSKALAFKELVTMIDATRYRPFYPSHVLLVLDSCQAGNVFDSDDEKNVQYLGSEPNAPVITVISAGGPSEDVKDDGFFTKTLITALETPREKGSLTATKLGHILHIKSSREGRSHSPQFGKLPNDGFTKRGQFIFWVPQKGSGRLHDGGS